MPVMARDARSYLSGVPSALPMNSASSSDHAFIGSRPSGGTPSISAMTITGSGYAKSPITSMVPRSEEHTSELQSRLHLVCRLLLEKKNRSSPSGFGPSPTLTHVQRFPLWGGITFFLLLPCVLYCFWSVPTRRLSRTEARTHAPAG